MHAAYEGWLDEMERRIKALASTHPHSIWRPGQDESKQYNCFEYAFELVDSDVHRLFAETAANLNKNGFFADSEFAQFLIAGGKLVKITEGEVGGGDVVIYFDDENTPQHAGKIVSRDMRVKSKWGGGLFLEHGLLEVPENYGSTVRLYQQIPAAESEPAFLCFVKLKEGIEEIADLVNLEDESHRGGD